jgi:hypothetical protein
MPKGPLFESRWAQQTAVSVAMIAVFALVGGVAALTTMRVAVPLPGGEGSVRLPMTWERVGQRGDEVTIYRGLDRTGLPAQQLWITRLAFSRPVPPAAARAGFVREFAELSRSDGWSSEPIQTDQAEGARFRLTQTARIQFNRQVQALNQLHLISVLTPDGGRTYYVFYLTNIGPYRDTFESDTALMREIEQSFAPPGE